MNQQQATHILLSHDIKPTANRLLVVRLLSHSEGPLTQGELEQQLVSVDKSVISRTLSLFREHHLVHLIESGEGLRYELCHSHNHLHDDDRHPHFHCQECGRIICLDQTEVPVIEMPSDYQVTAVSYMLQGICPDCRSK